MEIFTAEALAVLIVGIALGIYLENRDGRYSVTMAMRKAWDNITGK